MGEVITWIHFGRKFESSSKYVGGDTKILLLNNDVDYCKLKHMVAELLNVDKSSLKMHLNFQTGNLSQPYYDIMDDRMVKIFITFARQDSLKHSLVVTIDDASYRSTQGSNDPSDTKRESPNTNDKNVMGLKSY